MSAFDPNSNDAMFSRILTEMREHGSKLDRIEQGNTRAYEMLSARVADVESWRANVKGKLAVVATLISVLATGIIEAIRTYFHKGTT